MMDAIKFLKAMRKICKEHPNCDDCPAYSPCGGSGWLYPAKELVSITEKYLEDHPLKTRQSEFLKHYPNAPVYDDLLTVLPCNVDVSIKDTCADYENCYDCKKAYWSEEIE